MQVSTKPTLAIAVTSLGATSEECKKLQAVLQQLEQYFTVLPSVDLLSEDRFGSQSVVRRLKSLNKALQVADIVLAYNGGYNSIELFEAFGDIITSPQTVFIGYSDNTLLANALPVTKKARGWLGPMMASMIKYPKCIDLWAENIIAWLAEDYNRVTRQYNQLGVSILQPGVMRGKVIGGNAYTFDLLQGTPYAPVFTEPFIYILEGEDFITDKARVWQDTIRNLDSILLQHGARENLQGLLIGRFPDSYVLDLHELYQSVEKRLYLRKLPIAYNVPRGYWQPSLCLPLGEQLAIRLDSDNKITINKPTTEQFM